MLNCDLLTQTVLLTKQNQMMFTKNLLSINISLTLVTIQRFKVFDEANKNVIGKMMDEFEEKMVAEFFRLKSEMYSIKKN